MSITDKDVQLVVVLLIPTIKKKLKFQIILHPCFLKLFLYSLKEILSFTNEYMIFKSAFV